VLPGRSPGEARLGCQRRAFLLSKLLRPSVWLGTCKQSMHAMHCRQSWVCQTSWCQQFENSVPLVFSLLSSKNTQNQVFSLPVFLHQNNNGAVRASKSGRAAVIPNQKSRAVFPVLAVIGPVAPRPKNSGHTQLII